ncbi:MATE family efflux transporter [Reinekea forsetii]|nr:MATE family efflux transporter [Reinekea forsetii]
MSLKIFNFFANIFAKEEKTALFKSWSLAWPVILANMSMPLLGLTDAAILGHLDNSLYLAGVTAGLALMAYVFGGFNFLAMGLSGFTSQLLGQKNYSELKLTLYRYIALALFLIVSFILFSPIFIKVGLTFINPPAAVAEQAQLYLSIRMFGVPALVLNSLLLGFFIGMQNTKIGLQTVAVSQVANIGLNLWFVYGLGMTIDGIAWGTVISEYLGLSLILWRLWRTFQSTSLKNEKVSSFSIKWRAFKPIFEVSSHIFVRTFILLTSFLWFSRISADLGASTLAANGLLLQFFYFISHFLDGTAAAAEAQTGHAIGRNNKPLKRLVFKTTFFLTVGFMLTMSAFFGVFGSHFVALLNSQPDVLIEANQVIWLIAWLPITGGLAFWLDGIFIGARESKAMRNSVVFGFLSFFGISWFLIESNTGLWLSFHCMFMVRSLWLLTVFFRRVY